MNIDSLKSKEEVKQIKPQVAYVSLPQEHEEEENANTNQPLGDYEKDP